MTCNNKRSRSKGIDCHVLSVNLLGLISENFSATLRWKKVSGFFTARSNQLHKNLMSGDPKICHQTHHLEDTKEPEKVIISCNYEGIFESSRKKLWSSDQAVFLSRAANSKLVSQTVLFLTFFSNPLKSLFYYRQDRLEHFPRCEQKILFRLLG